MRSDAHAHDHNLWTPMLSFRIQLKRQSFGISSELNENYRMIDSFLSILLKSINLQISIDRETEFF